MKRIAICLLIAAISAFALCGCGARDERLDEMVVGTPIIPEVSPMVTPTVTPMVTPVPMPDADDGVVNDGDGVIEDSDTGRETNTGSKTDTANGSSNKTTVSPSPAVTEKP